MEKKEETERSRLEKNSGKRILVYLTACYALGVCFATAYLSVETEYMASCLLAGGICVAVMFGLGILVQSVWKKGMYIFLLGLYLLMGVLGLLRVYTADQLQYAGLQSAIEGNQPITGTVIEEPSLSSSEKTLAITLGELESGNEKLSGKVIVYSKNKDHIPKRRDRILVQGEMEAVELRGEPEFKGYRKHLLSEGIRGRGFCEDFTEIEKGYYPKTVYGAMRRISEKVRQTIQEAAETGVKGEENRSLLLGILIGEKKGMTEEQYGKIRDAGFSHVVAVSGMHLSYLVFLLTGLFSFAPANGRRFVQLCALPVLAVFVMVADGTPSVSRAALMCAMVIMGHLWNRSGDTITGVFFAGLILLLYNPYLLYSISFTLSFGSTIGIVVFSKRIEKLLPVRKRSWYGKLAHWIWGQASMTLGAVFGIGYLTAAYFGQISFGGLIGNIVVIPLVVYVFLGGYLQALVYSILPWLGAMAGEYLLEPVLHLLNWQFDFLSALGLNLSLSHSSSSPLLFLLLPFLLFLLSFRKSR